MTLALVTNSRTVPILVSAHMFCASRMVYRHARAKVGIGEFTKPRRRRRGKRGLKIEFIF